MIKAIIFDFFGVIGKSTYRMIHEDYQTTPEQDEQFKQLHKALDYEFVTQREFIESYAKILNISYEQMLSLFNNADRRFATSQALLDYVADLRKTYKIGLISNISRESFYQFIKPISNQFDMVLTSYQTKLAKPERAIFELGAQKFGVDVSECLMIDDNFDNCEGARSAGMEAIEFKSLNQLKNELKEFLAN